MNLVFSAIFPIFGMMALGAFAKKINILGERSEAVLSRFVFYFSLPATLFLAISNSPVKKALNIPYIAVISIGTFILITSLLCYLRFYKKAARSDIHIRAMLVSQPNATFMGIPILMTVLGVNTLLPIAIAALIFNIFLSFILIFMELSNKHSDSHFIIKFFSSFYKNPILIGILVGFVVSFIGIRLPVFLNKLLHQLAMTAAPCAMFAIGQSLMKFRLSCEIKKILPICFFKLVVHPAIVLVLMLFFRVPSLWAASGFIISGLPIALKTYIIAEKNNTNCEEVSAAILISTLFSVITISFAILILPDIWPKLHYN